MVKKFFNNIIGFTQKNQLELNNCCFYSVNNSIRSIPNSNIKKIGFIYAFINFSEL